jgi:glycosyltransferase involved in cell wall biosynthesis
MKILRVIASTNPAHGGPIEGLCQSTAVFARDGVQTELVSLDNPRSPWLADLPFPVHALGSKSRLYHYAPELTTWIREHASSFDVVIQHGLWNYTAYATGHALAGSSTPYFCFTHGMLDPWFKRTYPLKHLAKQCLWWVSEGPLLARARAVFFTSEEERLQARGAFWPYRVKEQVIGYGTADIGGDAVAQITAFRRTVPELKARDYLLYLSRIHPKKGCDLLVNAFAKVAQMQPDIDLVMAGPDETGWRRELEAMARAEGVEGRIHWPGLLRDDAKYGAFRGCLALILPSHQENFGIVVAEAMSFGRAVLITDKINIWREVVAGNAGLVERDDQAGIDRLLSRFLLGEVDIEAMGRAARTTFLEKFEIERTARSLLEAITEIVGQTTERPL